MRTAGVLILLSLLATGCAATRHGSAGSVSVPTSTTPEGVASPMDGPTVDSPQFAHHSVNETRSTDEAPRQTGLSDTNRDEGLAPSSADSPQEPAARNARIPVSGTEALNDHGTEKFTRVAAADEPLPIPPSPADETSEAGKTADRDENVSPTAPLTLDAVIDSVYGSYPLLTAALYSRNIADGQQMAAAGEFDFKLKAASENGPTGFYQTYRQHIGFVQPTYSGGEVFAGYRIGRGDFQPWYLERQTNGGGEFKAGVAIPLSRDRHIDGRRAELWRTTYSRQQVEPEIHAQIIGFIQQASYAYWEWVASGRNYLVAQRVLALAEDRTARIRRQVEEQLLDPPELTDNLRLVAERRAKLADAARKLQQSAAKLSVYVRGTDGNPRIPSPVELPDFPRPQPPTRERLESDVTLALERRPELQVLDLVRRQLDVDYAEASNEFRPAVDAVLSGSQDVGAPTSSKRDKSEFELEASLFVDVPLQRRKARGKMAAVQGKQAQLSAKRRLVEDKIVVDVQTAYAALEGAFVQYQETRKAVEYAEDLAQRERRNFEEGASDLLKVTLREQYAAESALKNVEALLEYYRARADYRASLAQDEVP